VGPAPSWDCGSGRARQDDRGNAPLVTGLDSVQHLGQRHCDTQSVAACRCHAPPRFNRAMPALTRRRDRDRKEKTWMRLRSFSASQRRFVVVADRVRGRFGVTPTVSPLGHGPELWPPLRR
jgi:hypothetical protein